MAIFLHGAMPPVLEKARFIRAEANEKRDGP